MCWGRGVHGKSQYQSFNFVTNLKLLKKKNILNKNKQILLACESFVFTCKLFMLFSELPRGKEGI